MGVCTNMPRARVGFIARGMKTTLVRTVARPRFGVHLGILIEALEPAQLHIVLLHRERERVAGMLTGTSRGIGTFVPGQKFEVRQAVAR